ncbi:DUF2585 family protein [Falsirhodobacter sp. 20TX0035]|uniref:DUF2585 family protein n=1 Tax=Falsirhodobacter sp. 20TX0035 TaxID=3022019 RepID=UPI00232BD7BC|nr:DUF2585 family protein [Falsirhodobacter sp. 20TX0035]MDB6453010.1 DUF2585 family protein [Falsirhodobacter sp. 20TX0035]
MMHVKDPSLSTFRMPFPVLPAMLVLLLVQVVALHLMGRDAGCDCGWDVLWQRTPDPAHNSQHFADPYSLLHFGFGVAVFSVLALMRPLWRRRDLALLVVFCSVVWEVMENLPIVIDVFGYSADDPLAYDGDSILNSLGDTAFALAGGIFAAFTPLWMAVLSIVAVELWTSLSIGDGYVIGLLRAVGLV